MATNGVSIPRAPCTPERIRARALGTSRCHSTALGNPQQQARWSDVCHGGERGRKAAMPPASETVRYRTLFTAAVCTYMQPWSLLFWCLPAPLVPWTPQSHTEAHAELTSVPDKPPVCWAVTAGGASASGAAKSWRRTSFRLPDRLFRYLSITGKAVSSQSVGPLTSLRTPVTDFVLDSD